MNPINYTFFEEFKRLSKLCNDMYNSTCGVTNYIDDMLKVPHNKIFNIPSWTNDLIQLKRLRHIRNILAHETDALNNNLCTKADLEWIQSFYTRILKQSDPLSLFHQNEIAHTAHPMPTPLKIISDNKSLSKTTLRKFIPLIIVSILAIALIVFVILCIFIFLVIYH